MKHSFFCLLFFIGSLTSQAQTATASPGWIISVPTNTITEAGNDYTTKLSSATNQTLLGYGLSKQGNYTVSVHKIDSDWDARLSLWAVRTGEGTGATTGSIVGGTTSFQLTNSPQQFFKGGSGTSTKRENIPIQYEIRGLSVLLPVKTYTTTVVYTVSE